MQMPLSAGPAHPTDREINMTHPVWVTQLASSAAAVDGAERKAGAGTGIFLEPHMSSDTKRNNNSSSNKNNNNKDKKHTEHVP